MESFFDHFLSYYFTASTHTYSNWQPKPSRPIRKVERRKINIVECAEKYKAPTSVQLLMNQLITSEIHAQLVSAKFDSEFFEKRGFKVLKGSDTRVIEHPCLPGFLIKTAVEARVFLYHTATVEKRLAIKHTNLLRTVGHEYFSHRLEDDSFFTLPEEYLYESPHADREHPLHHRFYAVSKKVDIYSPDESVEVVRNLSQLQQLNLAQKVCDFIQRTGLSDMHSENLLVIRGLEDYKFAIIDQEPLSVFIENSDNTDSLLGKKDRALLGLLYFRDRYCREHGFSEMAHYVDQQIQNNFDAQKVSEFHDTYFCADRWTVIKILITIPFFFIILPILALRAACSVLQSQVNYNYQPKTFVSGTRLQNGTLWNNLVKNCRQWF